MRRECETEMKQNNKMHKRRKMRGKIGMSGQKTKKNEQKIKKERMKEEKKRIRRRNNEGKGTM